MKYPCNICDEDTPCRYCSYNPCDGCKEYLGKSKDGKNICTFKIGCWVQAEGIVVKSQGGENINAHASH